ncbi:MAG: RNA pseudouridine synthase [Bacillota bacterium]|nr:MAG: RNA pseudouridine synthase [Bacillota bacterium]
MKKFEVPAFYAGERTDVFLAANSDLTRSHIKKLCDDGKVFLNGKTAKGKSLLKAGDVVLLEEEEIKNLAIEPENIPLDIVYQDEDIAVINKPQGLTVHAGNGTHGATLVNALLYHLDSLSGINGVIRPGIVHRIDKNTSGLLVVAKNDAAHLSLSRQIEEKTCKRIYVALLEGVVKEDGGTIETHIERSEKDRTKMAVSSRGRLAVTDFKVLKRYAEYTLAEFSLRTGRTHQIRVHAKYINHPVVGDKEYGYKKEKFNLAGQLLHAKELELTHPRTGERMRFFAPLPDYFESVLKKLK